MWDTCYLAGRHVGSSWTRGQTGVPCIARQILNHWTTMEAPFTPFKPHDSLGRTVSPTDKGG